jgi:hypothetical protein
VNLEGALPDMNRETELPPDLEEALKDVPKGALALAGATVGLLILAWLFVYIFVFLPRGTVG